MEVRESALLYPPLATHCKRTQCSGVPERLDSWIPYVAKRGRNTLGRRYQYLYGTLRLTRLCALRRNYRRDLTARYGRNILTA